MNTSKIIDTLETYHWSLALHVLGVHGDDGPSEILPHGLP